MPGKNKWYVITGGPSTGKTTILEELEKLGHKTIPEAARKVIDDALERGISVEELRSNEKDFQEKVALVKQQVEAEHDPKTLTFFDRGMQDTLAYMNHYCFDLEDWIVENMGKSRYQKVFLLDPLPNYKIDYARTEGPIFLENINRLLFEAYSKHGMKPIRVPANGLDNRVKFILENL